MRRIPTDMQILDSINERYYKTFSAFVRGNGDRSAKNYVPIDIKLVAQDLRVDPDIVFGRLYYHLDKKYGFRNYDGSLVPFFVLDIGDDRHCIHFPLMASVLAGLRTERSRHQTATRISFGALVISAIATTISLFALLS